MFQDFSLFSAPISINVSAKADISLSDAEKIVDSLKKVGLYERIKLEENGIYSQYTKTFDQNGVSLSGGEMQKLALARVFTTIHRGTINIFDEPSAALDVESEELFYKNLIDNAEEGISLFISHRLSTTINADCIFMLENGEILEKGNHLELMKNNGRYAYIFNLHADKYKYETLNNEISINKYE
jgi:ATP-binding cassette subfamily B protein